MTYMRSWKSLRLNSHTWLGLNPQIGRPLSRIVVPLLVYLFLYQCQHHGHKKYLTSLTISKIISAQFNYEIISGVNLCLLKNPENFSKSAP
jgi:hypothetical protein